MNQFNTPYSLFNAKGHSPVLLVCEHASRYIPESYNGLGLDDASLQSHIAWDPGAAAVAHHLSYLLDAPLLVQRYSRLLYDCNRPPEASSAIPTLSENTTIPGNRDLPAAERERRIDEIYEPFHKKISELLTGIRTVHPVPVLMTIHSFTKWYKGDERTLDLGIISDADNSLSETIRHYMDEKTSWLTKANEPYDANDGVTHTLQRHAHAIELQSTMIEIRNDLISDAQGQHRWAAHLANAMIHALNEQTKTAV